MAHNLTPAHFSSLISHHSASHSINPAIVNHMQSPEWTSALPILLSLSGIDPRTGGTIRLRRVWASVLEALGAEVTHSASPGPHGFISAFLAAPAPFFSLSRLAAFASLFTQPRAAAQLWLFITSSSRASRGCLASLISKFLEERIWLSHLESDDHSWSVLLFIQKVFVECWELF